VTRRLLSFFSLVVCEICVCVFFGALLLCLCSFLLCCDFGCGCGGMWSVLLLFVFDLCLIMCGFSVCDVMCWRL